MNLRRFPLAFVLALAPVVPAAQTGSSISAAPTPPMGWNSWDSYGTTVREEQVKANTDWMAEHLSPQHKLAALAAVCDRLQHDFGGWRVPWGDINRYQRLTGAIVQNFTDAGPSLAVPFTAGRWGSLASFGARRYEGTNKYYGTTGNSFVAVVEFGEKVSARAVSIGGESADPKSAHFADQTARYIDGALRPVYFYPADLAGHVERRYHPAESTERDTAAMTAPSTDRANR